MPIAGDAMARRSTYQYGTLLAVRGDGKGKIDAGLGKDIQQGGTVSFQTPDITVVPNPKDDKNPDWEHVGDTIFELANIEIDGICFEFFLCPETEAPAEMTIRIEGESRNCLIAAEVATHTLHNILTPRGAEVRDTRKWWKTLDKLLLRYGESMSCICATHHWSVVEKHSKGRCRTFLEQQRDTYKFLHDQTVRLLNRGYYGTVSHDVRAIYQKYLGWYDMNPSNLNPLPPNVILTQLGRRRLTRL